MKGTYYALGLLLVFGAVFAAAAALNVSGGVVQAGLDNDLVCDPSGVFVTAWIYENDTLTVEGVKIGGIDGACFGLEMHVDVYDSGGGHIGAASTVIPDSVEETFLFTSPVYVPDLEEIHVGITT